jgi:hypothetical protein
MTASSYNGSLGEKAAIRRKEKTEAVADIVFLSFVRAACLNVARTLLVSLNTGLWFTFTPEKPRQECEAVN